MARAHTATGPRAAAEPRPAAEPDATRDRSASLRLACTAALLFGSGACALTYQTTWLRELRLVFGASTQASAAALAIFMAGLGAGSAWLGPRADRERRP